MQYLFTSGCLDACQSEGAFLIGDASGLGHLFTGEGILPAALSGKLCAKVIIADRPKQYAQIIDTTSFF